MVATTRTRLVQNRVGSAMDSLDVFRASDNKDQLPIVLIPDDRMCCSCVLTVPSGVHCVMHKWGNDIDEKELAAPGMQCLGSWNRVAYCVSPQSCTYNAPVKSCPTSDNVMVDCDLTLVFRIGPDPPAIKQFVYNLGAHRFDEFLAAATEEGIRQLVRQTPHSNVYELRGGSLVRDMLQELNDKFNKFGVTFTKAAITDVQLGQELAHTLQATTEFQAKIQEQQKRHDHNVKGINFEAEQKIEELRKFNERKIQDLHAAKTRALITREQKEIDARSALEIAVTRAEEKASVNEARATSQAHVAKFQGKKEQEDILAASRSRSETVRIQAIKDADRRKFEAQKSSEAAKDQADALRIEAESEGRAAESLKQKRLHTLEMAKREVLEAVTSRQRLIIGGESGDRLLRCIMDDTVLNGK